MFDNAGQPLTLVSKVFVRTYPAVTRTNYYWSHSESDIPLAEAEFDSNMKSTTEFEKRILVRHGCELTSSSFG